VHALATAGTGFLLAVLWFDLMFDTEGVVDSVAAYYRRVTTTARPMNRLVALTMLVTIVALVAELVRDPDWAAGAALVLVLAPISLAAVRTVPSAVRLGSQDDPSSTQSRLARTILRDHLMCAVSVTVALVVQLTLV
jgi:hypothetical protein